VPVLAPEDLPKGALHIICMQTKTSRGKPCYRAGSGAARLETRSSAASAGVRKEVTVSGVSILLFWYRNEIYAIEARCAGCARLSAADNLSSN